MNRAARRHTAQIIKSSGKEGKALAAMVDLYDLIKGFAEHSPPEISREMMRRANITIANHGFRLDEVQSPTTVGIA
jgi:hypothetical protein